MFNKSTLGTVGTKGSLGRLGSMLKILNISKVRLMSSSLPVIGGKLKFKDSNNSSKKKKRKIEKNEINDRDESKQDLFNQGFQADFEASLTENQRKYLKRKEEIEARNIKNLTSKSYRDRVEDFNQKLSKMTEHNDIPRVSAAGNG